jgi:transposase
MLKRVQRSYTAETRQEAVGLAGKKGAAAASQELGIPLDTLYTWISRAKNGNLPAPQIMPPEARRALTQTDRIKELEQENRRLRTENIQLKREHQILEEATVFFAGRRKRSGSS